MRLLLLCIGLCLCSALFSVTHGMSDPLHLLHKEGFSEDFELGDLGEEGNAKNERESIRRELQIETDAAINGAKHTIQNEARRIEQEAKDSVAQLKAKRQKSNDWEVKTELMNAVDRIKIAARSQLLKRTNAIKQEENELLQDIQQKASRTAEKFEESHVQHELNEAAQSKANDVGRSRTPDGRLNKQAKDESVHETAALQDDSEKTDIYEIKTLQSLIDRIHVVKKASDSAYQQLLQRGDTSQ